MVKCGALKRTHDVFDEMGVRDLVGQRERWGGEDMDRMVIVRDLIDEIPVRNEANVGL